MGIVNKFYMKETYYLVEFRINSNPYTWIKTEIFNLLETAKEVEKSLHSKNILARIVKVVNEKYCIN